MTSYQKIKTKWGHGYWWSYHEIVRTMGLETKSLINLVIFVQKLMFLDQNNEFSNEFE